MEKIYNALQRAGLEPEHIKLTGDIDAIRIPHNYDGMYRDDAAREKMMKAFRIANKYGYNHHDMNTASFIY